MLEYIRSNAQSFGVKLAFGVIILVFVFWGVGSLSDRTGGNHVAMVNGSPISARDFELAYRHAEDAMRRNNPGLPREALAQELGRQVLRDLVTRNLLSAEAARAGITVTPLELRMAIGEVKAFQDAQGRFDPEAYKRVLEAQRMSPARYEQEMAGDMLRQKLFALVTASVWTDPEEARNRYDFLREQRSVEYAFFSAAAYAGSVAPTEEEVQAYYDARKADFGIPARVALAYVLVRAEALGRAESIGESEALAWYEANTARFAREEEVRAAHILVPLAEDAAEDEVEKAGKSMAAIEAELAAGKAFAAVADAHNGPNAAGPGGELGWIRRGMTVEPFEQAAFALKPGAVSAPVRSPFGLHLIKVEEKKPGGVPPFAEAAADVRKAMAQERGESRLHDVLDNLVEANILGKSLKESADALGLEFGETGLASAAELEAKLHVKAGDAASLLAVPAGSPVDSVLEAGDAYLVVRVLKSEAASTRPLAQVREDIVEKIRAEKALTKAMEAASQKRGALSDGPPDAGDRADLKLHAAPTVERGGALPGFAPDQALSEALFSTATNAWLPGVYAVTSSGDGPGALFARVSGVRPPEAAEWEAVRDIMVDAMKRERAEGLFEIFMQRLLSRARIEVLDPALVDRKNM